MLGHLWKEPTLSQYEASFKKYDAFGASEYETLADHCKKVGIEFISTPFDDGIVECHSNPLVPFSKTSADITEIPLLWRVARLQTSGVVGWCCDNF